MEQLAVKSGAMGPDSRAREGGARTGESGMEGGGPDVLLGALPYIGADTGGGGGGAGGEDGTDGSAGGGAAGGAGGEVSRLKCGRVKDRGRIM